MTASAMTTPMTTICTNGETLIRREAVAQDADDEHAERGAGDGADAAGEAGAADHHGRDRVELVAGGGAGLRGVQAHGEDDGGDAGQQPGDGVDGVTLTFLKEGGTTVVEHRTIPAQSRMTVHVDQIAGLEEASASVQVASGKRLPLIVERSMFWDQSYYGGHTANAVAKPETRWIFAEGFQGFFDTYILIANANDTATTATLTFLREGDTPIVKTVPVGPFARKTVYAGDYPEIVGRPFGIVVDATLPVIAERAMYFARSPASSGPAATSTPASSYRRSPGSTRRARRARTSARSSS